MTPEQQKAYYAKNKADSDAATKADMERRVAKEQQRQNEAGESAIKGMMEGRMDAMGNAYKKGGKIMEHKHNVEHVKTHYGKGHDHMHHQEHVKKEHGTPTHKMHHEHVMAMCGGGYMKGKK